ncbi:MAG: oligosaccharide flippase family protein [Anaerolineales bacterium]|nr:oligosaccharide flippase family protein [Anaerolineales bacterium]
MRPLVRRLAPDLLVALGLLLLPLTLFAPVTLGGRTLLPADNLLAIEPWRSAAAEFGAAAPIVPHNKLLDDLVLENYPWKKFILESLQAGELPLWNPYQFAGLPFLAGGQHSALYPFSVIYYLIPLPRAYGVFTVSQFFLAGLFAYLFIRALGRRRWAALVGAIVYELSLFMVVSVVFPMITAAAAWLPLVLLAVDLIVRQQRALGGRPATVPWLALGAGALGMQVLAGHVEILYYTLLIAGLYAGWRLGGLTLPLLRGREGERGAGAQRLMTRGAALLAMVGVGLALGAIQFIPLIELVQHNFRSGSATFDQIVGWSFPWRRVVHFLVPNFFGNPAHHGYFDLFSGGWVAVTQNALGQRTDTIDWGIKNFVEGGAYVGLLPLVLSAVAVWGGLKEVVGSWRGRRVAPGTRRPGESGAGEGSSTGLGTVAFFTLLALLALGFIFPTRLYALIFWLPGINQLHSPFRWVWPLSLCVAVLTAFGLERLWVEAERRSPGRGPAWLRPLWLWADPTPAMGLAGLLVWGGAATLAALAVARLGYDALGLDALTKRLVQDLALASRAFADGRMFFSYEARWLAQFAGLAMGTGLVVRLSRWARKWRGQPVWAYAAVALLVVDLAAAGWGFNPAANPDILTYTPPSVSFLREADPGLWRYTTYDPPAPAGETQPKPFNANAGWYFDLYDVRGYDSIFTQQYKRYMQLIQNQYELDFNRIAPLSEPGALHSPLLDMLNVRYVLTQDVIDDPQYTLVYDGEVRIYRNEHALARAYTLPAAQTLTVPDFGAAMQGIDPRAYVILEQPGAEAGPVPPAPAWPAPVEDIVYAPNEVLVTAAVDEAAWLVLADSYFPGWKAYVRPTGAGEEAERPLSITLVNGNFRGVQLPPGDWTVRFKYSPDSVKLGGVTSFIALVTLVFMLGVFTWRYFYREAAVDSTARRVAKNSLAPIALNLGNRLIDLVFAAFMLRVLEPEDAGKYYFAVVVFGWFEIVTNYGLDTLLMRDVARDRAHASRYLLNTTVLRLLLGLAAIPALGLFLLARQRLPSFALPFGLGALHPDRLTNDTLWAIALLVLAQAPATLATGLAGLFRAFERAEYPAAVATVATLARVSLGTVALVAGLGFVGLAGVSVAVNVLTLSILGTLAWRLLAEARRPAQLDAGFQRHALRESFPLMLNNLLATLFFKVDVTLLEPVRGPTEVGWYSTGYKYIDAFNTIPSLFTFALFPVLSRQAANDPGALRRSYLLAVKLLVMVALPVAVVTAALATPLVGLLGGAEYLPQGALALAILVWSIPFGWVNSITNYVLIALGQQRALTRAFAVSLVFNVAFNLALLPRYGFAAAAAVTIASEVIEGLLFYRYFRRSAGPVAWLSVLGRLWLAAAGMGAVTLLVWPVQPGLALLAGLVVYAGALAALRPFGPGELALLRGILPERWRRG